MSATAAADVRCPPDARVVTDPTELFDLFGRRRGVHVYSLVDLEEPFWSSSRWFRRGDAVVGVVGTPADGLITATGVSVEDPVGSLDMLGAVVPQLPSGLVITGPTGLDAALTPHRRHRPLGRHVKYELVDRSRVPAVDGRIRRLGAADIERLVDLYAMEPGAAFFLPSMVGDDTFVGVEDESGELVAAAGTHVMSATQRIAAIGSVYVRSDHRRAGLGRAVTVGVLAGLTGRCDVIGLNVDAANAAARAIYESLGFAAVLDYDEALLI